MTLVKADGFEIDVGEAGSGAPVVAVHSTGMSRRQWARLSSALASSFHVVCPNLLGYGLSGPWSAGAPYRWDDDARLLAALLGTLDQPAHLVGHSYGGLVAAKVAMTTPARVRSLVVYEPVAFGVLYDAADAEGIADLAQVESGFFRDEKTGGNDAWLEGFVDYWGGAGAWRALPQAARDGFLAVGKKAFAEVVSLSDDRTTRSAFAQIGAPTLLLSGTSSPVAARRVCALLAEAIPGAILTTIAGAGHMGPLTHADKVNGEIAAFVARTPALTAT